MADDHSGGDVEGKIESPLVVGDMGPTIVLSVSAYANSIKGRGQCKHTNGFVSPGDTIGTVIYAIGAIGGRVIEITVGRMHVQGCLDDVGESDLGR